MKRLHHICVLIIVLLTLNACASYSSQHPPGAHHLSWEQRQAQLHKINHWQIRGALGMRTPQGAQSASLNWQQRNANNYTLYVMGPLGTGTAKISGSANQVTLATSDGQTRSAPNAQTLLLQQFGWQLPIASLRYWVRGLPDPHYSSKKQLDQYNHLVSLQQRGWQIQYQRYVAVTNIDLPSKLTLTNPQFRAKLIIKQWQIG